MNKPELLAPAGDLKKLKYALAFGADAVYCGLPDFSLRYRINAFDYDSLKQGIEYAHSLNKKVYVTVNIFPHKKHLQKLADHVDRLKILRPDALIVSDPGVVAFLKEAWPSSAKASDGKPEIDLHLSTQANCTNWRSAKFWFENGIKRIILAREATLEDIKEIHEKVPEVELESFVHGAMCMSYSGRCILSKWFTDRSANLGDCSQPCRWSYNLVEEKRPGAYFPIEQDQHGTYIMNSKDLCLIEHLKELEEAGICSFKIEGRAKSIYYVAVVTKVYRKEIDRLVDGEKGRQWEDNWKTLAELNKTQNRGFTTGFLFGEENVEHRFNDSHQKCEWEFCGEVVSPCLSPSFSCGEGVAVQVHNQLFVGDEVEFVTPIVGAIHELPEEKEPTRSYKITKIIDQDSNEITEAHGGQSQLVYLPLEEKLPEMTVLRRKIK